jgi:hypothetical protein
MFENSGLEINTGLQSFISTATFDLENVTSPTNQEILAGAFSLDKKFARGILESKYPAAYELMMQVGIHPDAGEREFYNPILNKLQRDNFSNIGDHLSCVGLVADSIGSLLEQHGVITKEQRAYATSRALMHDASKPYQVFLIRALREGLLSQEEFYSPRIDSYYRRCVEHLVESGVAAEEAHSIFFDYGTETGSEPERMKDFILADSSGLLKRCKASIETQIVHLADDMVGSTKPLGGEPSRDLLLSTRERVLLTQPRDAGCPGWRVGLVWSEARGIESIPDIRSVPSDVRLLGSSYGLQIWASDLVIAPQLCSAIGINVDPSQAAKSLIQSIGQEISRAGR